MAPNVKRYPPFASTRDLFESTFLSRLRKLLVTETVIALLVTTIVHCVGLHVYPWVIAGLLCNIGLEWIVWACLDGLYSPYWTHFLAGSRVKQTAYLIYTADAYAFKTLCRLALNSLRNLECVLSWNGFVDTLVTISWITTNILDYKTDGSHLEFLLQLPKIAASSFGSPLFRSISWLYGNLIFMTQPGSGHSPLKYSYLPLEAGEIRLLRLSRRLPYSAPSLEILNVKLTDAPPYEAISYVWGNSQQTCDVWVDGRIFQTSLAAYEVLLGRGSMWRSRLIWIDYICINQEDLYEKATQVEQMTQVYSKARSVVVWLGGHLFDRSTTLTNDMIHQLDLKLMRGGSASQVYEGLALHQDTDVWRSFVELWSHPWFTRVWVVQEAAVAKNLYFCYGGLVYPWRCFNQIAKMFMDPYLSPLLNKTVASRKAHSNMSTLGFVEQIRLILWHNRSVETLQKLRNSTQALKSDSIREAVEELIQSLYNRTFRSMFRKDGLPKDDNFTSIPLSFAYLLSAFATLQVTDDRDRVFALRGMVTGHVSSNTRPDYIKPVEMLYNDLATDIWLSELPFAIVGWAGVGLHRRLNVASFVPDWSFVPKHYVPLTSACFRVQELGKGYRASGDTKPKVNYNPMDDGMSIDLEAVVFDTVCMQTDGFPHKYFVDDDISSEGRSNAFTAQMKWLGEVHNMLSYARSYSGDDAVTDALWRTLIGDRRGEQYPAPNSMFKEYQGWLKLAEKFISNYFNAVEKDRQPTLEELSILRDSLSNTWSTYLAGGCCGRRFGITEKGRMGMFLSGTQVGDEVCIAYGAATPWVIRRMNKKSTTTSHQFQDIPRPVGIDTTYDYQLVGECYIHGVMKGEVILQDHQTSQVRLW